MTVSKLPVTELPSGEVTLMFTDIEGSTKAWARYGDIFHEALEEHNSRMRSALTRFNGYEVKTIGDSFMVAFHSAADAINCSIEMVQLIESGPFEAVNGLRIRIGIHSGELTPHSGDYFGPVVNMTSRIEQVANGGQILISEETANSAEYSLCEDTSLNDCGLHRLKDLGAPVRLFLVEHISLPKRDYPPLRTLNALPHNFPEQTTSFIGRDREKRELRDLILKKGVRLVTMTGPGGMGKTRLSMQVAADVVYEFKDGIWLIELASLSDHREVPGAVALAMKVPVEGGKGVAAQVFSYLRETSALLIFDNYEQVIDAAGFIGALLKSCPGIACLVTSQHLLQLNGETEFPLQPLELPSPDATFEQGFQSPTIQLFMQRAQSAKPSFVLDEDNIGAVAEICSKLDGSPLAIELTAALVRALSPQQLLPRLEDRFKLLASTRRDLDPRQRSLRGALDWSYELLSEEEQEFFAELAAFSGGFFIEDLEAVSENEMAFMLTVQLRDKSLLKMEEVNGESRYLMLETPRLYAVEKLNESGRAEIVRERHANRYLELSRDWSAKLNSSGEAMQRMLREIDNIRHGMDWALGTGHSMIVISYGEALGRFFTARGLYEEGERRLGEAEKTARENGEVRSLAQILLLKGRMATQKGNIESAMALYTESLQISESLGDRDRMVPPYVNLGSAAYMKGDIDLARDYWQSGLVLAEETNQKQYLASLLSNLSICEDEQGRFEDAINYLEQGLKIHRVAKNQKGIAYSLLNYSVTLSKMERHSDALIHLTEVRTILDELGDKFGKARAHVFTGRALLDLGDDADAEEHLRSGLAMAQEMNDVGCEALCRSVLVRLWLARNDLVDACAEVTVASGLVVGTQDERNVVELLLSCALILEYRNQHEEAEILRSRIVVLQTAKDLEGLIDLLLITSDWGGNPIYLQ